MRQLVARHADTDLLLTTAGGNNTRSTNTYTLVNMHICMDIWVCVCVVQHTLHFIFASSLQYTLQLFTCTFLYEYICILFYAPPMHVTFVALIHTNTRANTSCSRVHLCWHIIFLRNILTHKFMCCKEVASLSNAHTLQPNAIILHTTTTITTNKHLHTVFESRCWQFVAKCVKGNVMLDLKM